MAAMGCCGSLKGALQRHPRHGQQLLQRKQLGGGGVDAVCSVAQSRAGTVVAVGMNLGCRRVWLLLRPKPKLLALYSACGVLLSLAFTFRGMPHLSWL